MPQAATVNIDDLVDNQKITGFNWLLVFWCFIITLIDGYDISAAPAAGPFFVRDWHLASPAALTFPFSATNFGVLFGAPLFGWVGDRYGRKIAIILSLVVFGLFTMLVAVSNSVEHLTWARFLTGFGVGGVVSNTISLNAEMAPRRVRATFIILMFIGTTLGGIFPPIVANTLVGTYDWPIIFWIGGILPLVIAALSFFILPESIKYLSLIPSRRQEMVRLAARMGTAIGPNDVIVSASHNREKARFTDLFVGKFAVITPLMWLLFAINLMVFYFVNIWLQTIITPALIKAGGSAATAQNAGLMFQLGGSVCGLVMCRFVDKMGLRPVILLILLGIPSTAAIGYLATTPWLVWITFASGFCLLGIQFGLNATAGILYPTHVRALGVGYAFGIGRFGAFGGPALGGMLIGMNFQLEYLYLIAAAPLLISLVACIVMIFLHDTGANAPSDEVVLAH
ncbi:MULTISPECIES: MFS transporter [unclassified Beijerinckia]|uniref:MFS transporter n=1 Tax=unclassified Beijerinckia TaxID=2638183 RepID=UPI00089B038C|nr:MULTISPECIES: MFS transporter [unclassified Beijerinckia]MDH7798623.1 AAHS family 4-hydroxybenzoate transporter-like MFS transporter [Beijerinckia sp. GAS462]SED27061.1 MFS transporter, AAHS family, 4-hydroxybenzoate transporter [Beijerinckia sp. 28-YEA-48]